MPSFADVVRIQYYPKAHGRNAAGIVVLNNELRNRSIPERELVTRLRQATGLEVLRLPRTTSDNKRKRSAQVLAQRLTQRVAQRPVQRRTHRNPNQPDYVTVGGIVSVRKK